LTLDFHCCWCPECRPVHSNVAVNPSPHDFGEMTWLSATSNDNAPDVLFNADYDQDSIADDCEGTVDTDNDLYDVFSFPQSSSTKAQNYKVELLKIIHSIGHVPMVLSNPFYHGHNLQSMLVMIFDPCPSTTC
jgi:hypothetical protein